MIEKVKSTEQARSEYRFISAFEMDARYYGKQEGRQEGRQEGFADGSYQTKLATAKMMKLKNCDQNFIMEITGLSKAEVEKL